ncbi:heterokaryon incompatibility protein-domain-containing protein [Pyrenochaeta sp. MPI-SDFR-AT-0127]|nr:heterokaryon incompatibility protein-domain-containing protein [Pyrenochaeta sp. MPI-SDFR-AT-0127]
MIEPFKDFACPVCLGIPAETDRIPLMGLEAQHHDCETCCLLWNSVTAIIGPHVGDYYDHVVIYEKEEGDEGPLRVDVCDYRGEVIVRMQLYRGKEQKTPWREIGIGCEVGVHGQSKRTVQRSTGWLQSCINHDGEHVNCPSYNEAQIHLPTRVIDFGLHEDSKVKLHASSEFEVGKYIALSHYWGEKTPVMTTTKNLRDHLREIPSLPQTFLDAIRITRSLGVRYLWIDSLCILQDSREDWTKEAPLMAKVYGGSYVTIAADAAKNTNAGFLDGSRRHLHTPKAVTFVHNGEKGKILVRQRSPIANVPIHDWRPLRDTKLIHWPQVREHLGHLLMEERFCPLLARGWVFQERVLSPRTLHFGSSETGRESHSMKTCECSHLCQADNIGWWQNLSKNRVRSWDWMKIVDDYTSLDLTVQEDRLIALAGLAKELLWRASDPAHRLSIAPTWSWASTTAWVHYADKPGEFRVISVVQDSDQGASNAFQSKATVTIDACLTEISIQKASDTNSWYHMKPRYPISSAKNVLINIHWDTFDPCHLNGGIGFGSALPKDETQAHDYTLFLTSAIQGVLLIQESKNSHYQRVGFVSSYGTASMQLENEERDLNVLWEVFKRSGARKTFCIS